MFAHKFITCICVPWLVCVQYLRQMLPRDICKLALKVLITYTGKIDECLQLSTMSTICQIQCILHQMSLKHKELAVYRIKFEFLS